MAWGPKVKRAAVVLLQNKMEPQDVADLLGIPAPTVYTWNVKRDRHIPMDRPMKWEIVGRERVTQQ